MMKTIVFMARGHPVDEGMRCGKSLRIWRAGRLPRIAPAHGPPLWEAPGQDGDNLLIQPLPEYKFNQRIAW